MRRDTTGVVKGWARSSTGLAGLSDSGRLSQSRQQETWSSLGVSWLPDWGITGSEQSLRKPQRSSSRPGTPRPSTVEPLQSQTMAPGPAKENCSREAGGESGQTSKRRDLRRLQQRAALQSLNQQSPAHANPLHSTPEHIHTHGGSTEGSAGHFEHTVGLQSMPLLASGRQPGLPGRPAFQGAMPADSISADLLQPGHQAIGRDGSSRPAVPKLDFSRVGSTDAAAVESETLSRDTFWGVNNEIWTQSPAMPGIPDGVSSERAELGVHFDISIGLPLPGSPSSWEPFNPTFLGLSAPGFAQSRDSAQSQDSWGSQNRQLLPSYHLMSSTVSGEAHASWADDVSSDAHHNVSANAEAHCTVAAHSSASAEGDLPSALNSCRLQGCMKGAPETPQAGRQSGAGREHHLDHPATSLRVESIEYCLEVSPLSDVSPQCQSGSPGTATPVRGSPSPDHASRAEWSPFISHLLEDTVKGLFQSPFKRQTRS